MSPPHTMRLAGRADWALMTAVHDALRRDLDQLLHATASHASAWTRWDTLRGQLRFHLAAEHAAMWPRVTATLTGDPHGQALLDALDDERQLLARLAGHLAHEEADALPLISQIMSPGELGRIAAAIRGGLSIRHAGTTVPWALTGASPGVREQVLSQLPAPARLLYRTVWLPRYARITLAL
jgi:Hemerythrin HHE cation binding domain